jgi:hypothetical protein
MCVPHWKIRVLPQSQALPRARCALEGKAAAPCAARAWHSLARGTSTPTAMIGSPAGAAARALVGGCKVIACAAPVIIPTQPNVKNGGATLAPEGPLHKVPEAQTNGNRDAYTSYFKFTAKRQRVTGKQPPQ